MAFISEIHYADTYARESGVSEFVEVSLDAGDDPSEYILAFYKADGTPGLEVNLADVPEGQVTVDPETGDTVYVISRDDFDFRVTDPDGTADNNYEAFALVEADDSDTTVLQFLDIGGGTQNIEAQGGLADSAVSTNVPTENNPGATRTSIQFNEPDEENLVYAEVSPGDNGVCFCRGTLIRTPEGDRKVEDLKEGDLVLTVDNGPQPIRWHGHSTVKATGKMAPVRIAKGTLGATTPLMVSPQHRMLIASAQLEMMFGMTQGLVAATHLVNDDTITRAEGGTVEYHHIMFDRHELVWANDTVTESFFVAANGMSLMTEDMRAEFAALFPDLFDNSETFGDTARPTLKRWEADLIDAA
ncbi:Hint domain-containing protein [Aestuariibius insulae]|uniref:Hint domain-containing protein n=1 Tax=Aestuariibius insulae TaxID=2058287 RepID=UPI00345E1157